MIEMMEKDAKIYVAGHRGMVGSAIVTRAGETGIYEYCYSYSYRAGSVPSGCRWKHFLQQEKPEYVFLAAAKVGGIVANQNALADFMYDNMILGDECDSLCMEERL